MSRVGCKLALAVIGVVLAAGCGGSSAESSGQREGCSQRVSDPNAAIAVMGQAKPGDAVCFTGQQMADLTLRMGISGTADNPISLRADGAVVRSIDVKADHVTVEGFTVSDGDGVNLEGTGLVVRGNVVRNAADDGIDCEDCRDTLIESNSVSHTDGTGISVEGDRIDVRTNTVSDSVMIKEGDADGIRFFGTHLRLTGNTIRDIKEAGYPPEDAPHTDCFQTYELEDRPTYDVLIADNICENVDVHCLIASGKDFPPAGIPAGSTAITFQNNTCTVYGSQAVLIQDYPNVVVRNNTFTGPTYRAVILTLGSVNCAVIGNTVIGPIRIFEIDDASRPGFREEGNISR